MNSDQDVTDVIDEHFPYDGPHSPDTVIDALRGASALVRYANNATQYRHALPYGPTIHRAVGNVSAVVYGLDQLVGQLSDATMRVSSDPTMYDDRRDRPASGTAADLADALDTLRAALEALAPMVDRAHSISSHLGHDL